MIGTYLSIFEMIKHLNLVGTQNIWGFHIICAFYERVDTFDSNDTFVPLIQPSFLQSVRQTFTTYFEMLNFAPELSDYLKNGSFLINNNSYNTQQRLQSFSCFLTFHLVPHTYMLEQFKQLLSGKLKGLDDKIWKPIVCLLLRTQSPVISELTLESLQQSIIKSEIKTNL